VSHGRPAGRPTRRQHEPALALAGMHSTIMASLPPASATKDTPKGEGEEGTLSLGRFAAIVMMEFVTVQLAYWPCQRVGACNLLYM
jgi:hypothetical protein